MTKVKPLKARTMSLGKLQLETLDLIRKLRFQLQRLPHEPGMSDNEFLEQIVQPLEDKIHADRHISKLNRRISKLKRMKCTFCAGIGCVNGDPCPRCEGRGRRLTAGDSQPGPNRSRHALD